MFQPASLKGDSPTPLEESFRKRYLVLYVSMILSSLVPLSFFEFWFVNCLWTPGLYWLFFLLLPFNALLAIYLVQFSAIFISFLALSIVKLIHEPKEGIFQRNLQDKDYFHWNLRNLVKKWPLYIAASNPFPWFKNRFVLRAFGTKIGKHCICDNSWISSEFVSIGNNVILGMGSTLLTFGIEQDKFILKKIVVEDDALIGAKCVLLPGTTIRKGAKLSAHSYTNFDQELKQRVNYKGHPAEILSNNRDWEKKDQ